MKSIKLLAFAAALVALIASCDNGAEGKWKMEKDSIMNVNEQQRQVLDDLTSSLVEISASLDSIAVGEGLLKVTEESPTLTKKQMLDNLAAFKARLSENKTKLANLEKQLAGKDNQLAKLGNVVKFLKSELEVKEQRITQLEEELSDANASIESLQEALGDLTSVLGSLKQQNEVQREAIQQQDEALNTGYYVIGKKDELKDAGLLKRKDLKYENFDLSLFTKVDIRTFTQLEIGSKKAEILTGVPEDSYTIERNGNSCILKIHDTERFWSVSKYLVIEKK